MKFKTYPILIWFLDHDLFVSALFLSNKELNKSINGCFNSLVSAYMYFYGIRNAKFYQYYFNKQNAFDTMEKLFPLWPLKIKPKMKNYNTRISKWTRKCKEHFEYVKHYLDVLCQEYEYRYNKQHGMHKLVEWIDIDAPQLKIPNANIDLITLEWKSLNPKYRRKDIVLGYRLQYKAKLINDGIQINDFTKRDIPDWLLSEQSDWLR